MSDRSYSDRRRAAIEQAAFEVLAEKGYKAASMLEIARRAGASNETLYKWYGNKQGLFRSLVEANAAIVTDYMESELSAAADGTVLAVLEKVGAELVRVLTGERAIALNRAAAGDVHDTGTLGAALAAAGRGAVMPHIAALMGRIADSGTIAASNPTTAAEDWFALLTGDLQVRRVTGAIGPVTEKEARLRSRRAVDGLLRLYSPA